METGRTSVRLVSRAFNRVIEVLTTQRVGHPLVWKVLKGLALTVALGGLGSLVLRAAASPSPLNILAAEVALLGVLGVMAYLFLGPLRSGEIDEGVRRRSGRSFGLAVGLAYTIAVTAAVWLLWQSLNVPSPLYYLALAFAAAFVVVEIIYPSRISRGRTVLVLLQITVIGTLVQMASPWLNPNSVFSDMLFHWLAIESIVQSGALSEALGYVFYFPSFHLFNAAGVEAGLVGFGSFTLFNHGMMILAIPGSYLLARQIGPPRHALASALLLTFSLFFFLNSFALPLLLGINVMLLTLFALLQYQKTGERKWWGIFWLLAIFVFFSHPVNSMVLAAILGVYWFNSWFRKTRTSERKLSTPAAAYGVGYSAYLVFISVSAFTILVQALFDSGPRIYSARPAEVAASSPIPGIFIAQVTTSTMGFALLFFPAMIAIVSWLFQSNRNRTFMVGVLLAVALVPTVMVFIGRGQFGLQATRALPYLSIFLVFPAASGLLSLTHGRHRVKTKLAFGVVFIFLLALLSTTSYLTVSGNRFLSDSIPVHTAFLTDSSLYAGGFLALIPDATPLAMDPVLADFLAPYNSLVAYPVTPFPINHETLVSFPGGFGNASVALALSSVYLIQSGYQTPDVSRLSSIYAVRAYDNGIVRVYLGLEGP